MAKLMTRRDFLWTLAACGGAAWATQVLAGCGVNAHAVATDRARGTKVWTWLRMFTTTGATGVPSSEADYSAHVNTIDVAMPLNGGKLQADGAWLQEPWKLEPPWPQNLPGIAHQAGQLYMPGVGNDRDGIVAVLENPDLQEAAADSLIVLATTGRFDSPWDGVYLDLEGIPFSHRQQLSDFLYLLSARIRQAGLAVGVSTRGRTADTGPDPEDAYTYDFRVVAEVADYVDLRCFGYWAPRPRSIGPYWWLESCIQYALSNGIDPHRMTLGLGNFSRYWPDSASGRSDDITYGLAMALVSDAGATVEWIASNANGLVREWYAEVGEGHIWIHDGDTVRDGLGLIDSYRLLGITLFAPGMGDEHHWQVIQEWRWPFAAFLPVICGHPTGGLQEYRRG